MFTQQKSILRDLGNGLIMRRSTVEDTDQLAEFNRFIHADNEGDGHMLAAWTRNLMLRHPTFRPDDFTVIEEVASGKIVSTMNLISQTWSYEGIKFGVGRPELVGTLPEYRNRGLVRMQFEEIHKWSLERGEMVQAITGIPFYYRLFGYEMALDLDARRLGYEAQVPKLKEGEKEPYTIRAVQEGDLPFITELYAQTCRRSMITCERTPEIFRFELIDRKDNFNYWINCVITDQAGELLGFFRHPGFYQRSMGAYRYELKPGISWLDVTPTVVRYLWAKGQEYAKQAGEECDSFGFMLGAAHPAYEAMGNRLPTVRDAYAWYLRVPDIRGFLLHIKPVLEDRLAESVAVGQSRVIHVSFYRNGLKMVIEHGKITTIDEWKPQPRDDGDAAFPSLTFLQLLFGYRSFAELEYAFADCWCEPEDVRVLLNILFPKKLSNVYGIA